MTKDDARMLLGLVLGSILFFIWAYGTIRVDCDDTPAWMKVIAWTINAGVAVGLVGVVVYAIYVLVMP